MNKHIIDFVEQHKTQISCIEFSFDNTETNRKNPFSYDDKCIYNTFLINYMYYLGHKKKVNNIIENILKSTEQKEIVIYDLDIANDNFFNAIIENRNIKILNLPSSIQLDKTTIEKLLNSGLWKLECYVNFRKNKDLMYDYIKGLTIVNYPKVANVDITNFGDGSVNLKITEELTKRQIGVLKRLFEKYPQEQTTIDFTNKNQMEEIINIVKSNKIIIKNKENFDKDEYSFFYKKYNNIFFNVGYNLNIEPEYLVEKEEIMDLIINEVKSHKLTPLEEYMYLYNIVKMLKEYKETPIKVDSMYSRTTDFLFFNDYIVCVGYAMLLEELVNRLCNSNISIATYGCQILTEAGKVEGHKRCLVKIKDEKYEINGIYVSDPTWDSVRYYKEYTTELGENVRDFNQPTADIDRYNYFLLTKEEIMDENTKYYSNDVTDLMFGRNFTCDDDDFNNYFNMEIARIIKCLNPNKQITNDLISSDRNIISSPIKGELLITLIKNLYTKIYYNNSEEIDEFVKKTVSDNSVIQTKNFDMHKNKFDEVPKKLIKSKN